MSHPSPASESRPPVSRGHLLTEQPHPRSGELDRLPTAELVSLFCQNDLDCVRALEGASSALAEAVDAISERLSRGGRLFYLGAGTSGRHGLRHPAGGGPGGTRRTRDRCRSRALANYDTLDPGHRVAFAMKLKRLEAQKGWPQVLYKT